MPKNLNLPALCLAALLPLAARAQAPSPAPAIPSPPGPGSPATPAGSTPPSPPAPEPPTEAEKDLDAAIEKVGALRSVSADIRQTVDMLGQKFELSGQYLKGPEYRTYLKLSLAGLGDASGTMLQVCDGKMLWDFQQVLNDQGYSQLDVEKVFKKLDGGDFDPELRKQVILRMGFAGPEALLSGLRKALKFDRKEAGTLDGKAVWVLRGNWKDLGALAGPNQAPLPPSAPLPAYIPSLATVWIGQEDGWPYQVQLEGRTPSVLEDNRQVGPDGKPIGPKNKAPQAQPSKILLVYSNVQLNPELKPAQFAFQAPPGAQVTNLTDQFLVSLDQAEAARQAEKKAEAAKLGDLPQSIPVPRQPLPDAPPPVEGAAPPK